MSDSSRRLFTIPLQPDGKRGEMAELSGEPARRRAGRVRDRALRQHRQPCRRTIARRPAAARKQHG